MCGKSSPTRGIDSKALRASLHQRGAEPVIPPRWRPQEAPAFDAGKYGHRNVVERTFCRLKDFRRIATRYDKLAKTFLAALCIVATIIWWANCVQTLD